jgi:hypothetical protein
VRKLSNGSVWWEACERNEEEGTPLGALEEARGGTAEAWAWGMGGGEREATVLRDRRREGELREEAREEPPFMHSLQMACWQSWQ